MFRSVWLRLSGFVFLAGATVGANTITTVDSGGVGQYTSVVYGSDGLPLIAYYGVANGDLKVAHCQDAACTTSTKQTLDSAGDVGKHASVAIGANGLGIISYLDATNARIKVARCVDVACSSATTGTLTSAGPAGEGADIVVPADGRPVLAFRDAGTALRVARCTDASCSDATAVTIAPEHGNHPTIGVGGDGLPLAAGHGPGGVRLFHCETPDCGSVTAPIVVAPGHEGAVSIVTQTDAVLTRLPDGRGAIAHSTHSRTAILDSLRVSYRTCSNAACTTLVGFGGMGVAATPPFTFPLGSSLPGVAIRPDGRPILSGRQPLNGEALRVAQCSTLNCSSAAAVDVDGPGAGSFSSVALSPAGLGLVAYHADAAGGSLKTLYLDTLPQADLALTQFGGPNPVGAGQTIGYQVQLQNLGPDVAYSIQVTYTLPTGTVYESGDSGCALVAAGSVRCPVSDISPGATVFAANVQVHVPAGVTGPLVSSATVTTSSTDPNPANDTSSVSIGTLPSLLIRSPQVVEGDAGLREGRFEVELVDDGSNPSSVVASYTTGGGFATSGADYLPASGVLTFTPGATALHVSVSVVGDNVAESNERFFLQLTSGAAVPDQDDGVLILDDDPYAPVQGVLGHGARIQASLEGTGPFGPEDRFILEAPPSASFEIVADAISGDIGPLEMKLLDANATSLQEGEPTSIGGSVRMAFYTADDPRLNLAVRIRSGGCSSCGADDVYRLRAYDTTARVARFNNTGDQVTILLLQNPKDEAASARVLYWGPSGDRIGFADVTLPAHGLVVLNSASAVPGQSGSITILNGLPYGVLRGKAVALEPATGFSFDSPLEFRPR